MSSAKTSNLRNKLHSIHGNNKEIIHVDGTLKKAGFKEMKTHMRMLSGF